jgi:hypothetical protein
MGEPPDEAADPTPIRALLRRLAGVHVPRGDGLGLRAAGRRGHAADGRSRRSTGALLALYYRPTHRRRERLGAAGRHRGGVRRASCARCTRTGARSRCSWRSAFAVAWAALRRGDAPAAPTRSPGSALVTLACARRGGGLHRLAAPVEPAQRRSTRSSSSSRLARAAPARRPLLRGLDASAARSPTTFRWCASYGLHVGRAAALLGLDLHRRARPPRRRVRARARSLRRRRLALSPRSRSARPRSPRWSYDRAPRAVVAPGPPHPSAPPRRRRGPAPRGACGRRGSSRLRRRAAARGAGADARRSPARRVLVTARCARRARRRWRSPLFDREGLARGRQVAVLVYAGRHRGRDHPCASPLRSGASAPCWSRWSPRSPSSGRAPPPRRPA